MEIYTNDLTDLATDHADIIERNIKINNNKIDYIIQDGCCNLANDLRKILYKRLSKSFTNLIEYLKTDKDFDLEKNLFKIINDL